MKTYWAYCLVVALAGTLSAGLAGADDDRRDRNGRGGRQSRDRDDDDFEKRYREQQKKYEEQRREEVKKFQEQQREARKREAEWQKKLEEQYREDQKRQEEWWKKSDEGNRKRYEEQLKRQIRDAGRQGDRRSDFVPLPAYPPTFPGYGAVPDQARLPVARRMAAQFGPEFARTLSGLGAAGSGFDPRAAQVAADLAQRSQRLAELARRDADLAAMRQEYAGFDAGWRQLTPYLDRSARDPASRELAWRLYQTERQLRGAIGYEPRAAGPNLANVAAVARDQSVRLGQLATWARDNRQDANLAYDLRNAQREAQAFEELLARQAPVEQLREQHAYLAAALVRVNSQLQAVRLDAPLAELVQHVTVADRQISGELGQPVYQDDPTRVLIERTGELRLAADRLRREAWAVLGKSDRDVIEYYVQPMDQWAVSADVVHQMLVEGRPLELVRAGWQRVVDLTQVVGERVRMLDREQYPWIHKLSNDAGQLVPVVNSLLVPPAIGGP
jgi:hypothetical protein